MPSKTSMSLPNILTYARIAAIPVVVGCIYAQSVWQYPLWLRWVAVAVFIAAGITDYLDGHFARIWNQQSAFGRMLDPIADKLLVASCLLMLAADSTIQNWSLWAAIVILCREILVSGLREYLAALRVSVPVTKVAKWKTTMQLVAIGFLLAGEAGDTAVAQFFPTLGPIVSGIGIWLLGLSAVFTIYTGYDYFRSGIHHLIEEDSR
ncbi:putative CDP-diacylglycerol-glycerol-3-phosphate 3-phosphatidyltransferase [Bradyrhizobium sp. STM 3809]|nr:putative CDP-diacylglycerol-glycerol-3-phosphate 3-phosphatidyltransferase [Bradyrhizobium sp. STM 3809]